MTPANLPPSGQFAINVKRASAGGLLFIAGAIALVAAAIPWWSLSGGGGTFTASSVHFLPGDSYTASSGGSTGSLSYASQGIGPVGALYEGILAVTIVVGGLALLGAILATVGALGRIRNPSRFASIRNLTILAVVLEIGLVVVVPIVQPIAFHASSPPSGCSTAGGVGTPCKSFWGSVQSGGATVTWGADAGWYVSVAAVVFLLAAAVVWIASRREEWGTPTASQAASSAPDLDRLVQLKALADSGHLTPAEFQEVKGRILGLPAVQPSTPGPPSGAEAELKRLKELHDSGVISDQEYDDLRKRSLSRL